MSSSRRGSNPHEASSERLSSIGLFANRCWMKIVLSILSASILLMGCATPEEKAQAAAERQRREEMEHQKQLEEEARENFERERDRHAGIHDDREEARREGAEEAADRAREIAEEREEAAEVASRYRAYEVVYARQLGKRPSQLTPAERAWVREKFD